jgi:ABC-2 type transport system ATP-binding protein
VKNLSKGMVVQAHLALVASIDARLMILDEPTLGLDVLSRKAFYEMLIDEWCDGERSVLISTHQVEEIESLLSDVMMLNEGKLVLSISLEDMDQRFVALSHDAGSGRTDGRRAPAAALPRAGWHPRRAVRRRAARRLQALGQRVRPSLVDLFVALTRRPESTAPSSEAQAACRGPTPCSTTCIPLMQREWLQHRLAWALLVLIPLGPGRLAADAGPDRSVGGSRPNTAGAELAADTGH